MESDVLKVVLISVGNIRRTVDDIIGHKEDGRGRKTLSSIVSLENFSSYITRSQKEFIEVSIDNSRLILLNAFTRPLRLGLLENKIMYLDNTEDEGES